MNIQKPIGYEKDLSPYDEVVYDGYCGEPVGWGFRIRRHLGQERFEQLRNFGRLEYLGPHDWVLVTHTLSRVEAEMKYGPITEEERGAGGGFRSITFGTTKFIADYLRPTFQQVAIHPLMHV
jgi:hypothetical protein